MIYDEGFVLAIDQGTTGTRAMLFNHEGELVPNGWAYLEHRQIFPKHGWVEHDPNEIWENVKFVIKEAIKRSKVDPKKIVAIGVTNQRETTVVWDLRSGKPVYNAIVWQCRRTSKLVDYLRTHYFDVIRERTGLVPDPYFSSTKIWWLLDNIPNLRERASKGEVVFGTIDTWIIWNLTKGSKDVLTPEKGGAHVTDYSNASRTMLFNINKLDWDYELLEIQGRIPDAILPLPRPSSDSRIYGFTGSEVSKLLGGKSVPVCGDAGDQQAALFGQAGFNVGDVKSTYGTGTFILLNIGNKPIITKSKILTTVYYSLSEGKATYALEGSIFVSGAAIQWLRDSLGIIKKAPEVDELASQVPDTGGVYFVPAFVGLGAPYWDMNARGLIIGITRSTDKRHIARATLESIAYLTRDVLEVMIKEVKISVPKLKVDGGAARSDFLMQFQADILGIEVWRPKIFETTSLGVAYLAGLAVNFWKDTEEIKRYWSVEKIFKPKISSEVRERLYKGWKEAVKRALKWAKIVPWAYGLEEEAHK